jgi:hypothetical protein
MELALEAEVYCPIVDDNGNYVDCIPHKGIKYGIRCPCGSRKDKVFTIYSSFANHLTTKTHKKWIAEMNSNKKNYYMENEKLLRLVESQKVIIARCENEIAQLKIQLSAPPPAAGATAPVEKLEKLD